MKKNIKIVFIVCIVVVLAISMCSCSGLLNNMLSNSTPTHEYVTIDVENLEDVSIAETVAYSIVNSCVRVLSSFSNGATAAGAGFFVTQNGYVVTNRHVVIAYRSTEKDYSDILGETPMKASYQVCFAESTLAYDANLVAYSNDCDVAILKVSSITEEYPYLIFEEDTENEKDDSSLNLRYGQTVFTFGNPENMGMVFTSCKVASPQTYLSKTDTYPSIILDGNINHGNSGGVLVNNKSKVVGIVFARIEGSKSSSTSTTYGLGCAVPGVYVKKFLKANNVEYKTVYPE